MKTGTLTWIEGMQFVGRVNSGHGIVIDTAGGAGPSPMELLLMGVMGCTGMDVLSILKKKRQNVTGLKIAANGQQAETPPNYYTEIELEYVAYGDIDEEALRRAIELSETKYCSAMANLSGKTRFSSKYRVEKVEPSVEPVIAG